MSWKEKLFGKSNNWKPSIWPKVVNSEVIQTWWDYKNTSVPENLKSIGEELKNSAKKREANRSLIDRSVSELKFKMIKILENEIKITVCLDKNENNEFIKHAIICIPSELPFNSDLWSQIQIIGCSIEPNQPAFQMAQKVEKNQFNIHLFWPIDWNHAQNIFNKEKINIALPTFPNPIIFTNSLDKGQFVVEVAYLSEVYKDRLKNFGLENWHEVLVGNLHLMGFALQYLDRQAVSDLDLLKNLKPDPKGEMDGKVLQFIADGLKATLDEEFLFGSRDLAHRIEEFLADRFKACPICNYEINQLSQEELSSRNLSYQFIHGLVYPINKNWIILTCEYQCPKCKKSFRQHKGLTLTDTAPSLPNSLPGPLIPFLQSVMKKD